MQINDGTGNGYSASVTSKNRLSVEASSQADAPSRAAAEKRAWMVNTGTTADTLTITSTGGVIAAVENPSTSTKTVVIERVQVSVSATMTYKSAVASIATGTPGNANTFTAVPTYSGGDVSSPVSCYTWDESGGSDGITNWGTGTELSTALLAVGTTVMDEGGVVVLTPGQGFSVALKAAGEATINILFYEAGL